MRNSIKLLFIIHLILRLSAIVPVSASNSEPSIPILILYSGLFFFMNTIQEIIEVLIFVLIWKEIYRIVKLRNRGDL